MQLTNLFLTITAVVASTAQASNIVLSNDDGWAEINIREFYDDLTKAGNAVVISAPAVDRSGTGSSDAPPTPLIQPCEFNSCPAGSPGTGFNKTMKRFNYVNSFPVTSMRYGIQTLAPKFFKGKKPDLAVTGFNVGANLGPTVLVSGTVGATTEAAKEGIPALAFSGSSGDQTAWNARAANYVKIYARLSTLVTEAILKSGQPYLPKNVWLNVNYPEVSSRCNSASDFKFVLSRINDASANSDVRTCRNGGKLPTETSVVDTKPGCYASISVGLADSKKDAPKAIQAVVLKKLSHILSCLP